MKWFLYSFISFNVAMISCSKSNECQKSKTDYIPIISAHTSTNVALGQPIISRVQCGHYNQFADVTFLGFEIKQVGDRQFEIRAKGLYENIQCDISLPVISTFDTAMNLQPLIRGQYILKYYGSSHLVEVDTVQVN